MHQCPAARCSRAIVKTCGSGVLTVLPARAGGPHGDLDVVVAMPGYFGHAESLVEGLGAAVDGEHVKDEILAFLPGLVDECLMRRVLMPPP